MERELVYKAINSEREYQEQGKITPSSHIVNDFPLSAALEAIRYNIDKANKSWYNEKSPYPESMECMRKIAAICVQMGEHYGMKNR